MRGGGKGEWPGPWTGRQSRFLPLKAGSKGMHDLLGRGALGRGDSAGTRKKGQGDFAKVNNHLLEAMWQSGQEHSVQGTQAEFGFDSWLCHFLPLGSYSSLVKSWFV